MLRLTGGYFQSHSVRRAQRGTWKMETFFQQNLVGERVESPPLTLFLRCAQKLGQTEEGRGGGGEERRGSNRTSKVNTISERRKSRKSN